MDVARRYEAKHLQLTLALAAESIEFGPGRAAAFGGPGGYSNRVTGLGLTPSDIDAAISFFDARGEDTKVEITSYANGELIHALNERGFQLRHFTHLLARTPVAGQIALERLDKANIPLVEEVARHNESCFMPGVDSPMARELTKRQLLIPTNDTFLARQNGALVGVGCSESSNGVTILSGGAVSPEARGRGLQRALIDARLAIAAERGSELVCVMVGPGTSSERNALRAGFQLAYMRAFFTRAKR